MVGETAALCPGSILDGELLSPKGGVVAWGRLGEPVS